MDEIQFFGDQTTENSTTYVTGSGSGFAFDFTTGVAVELIGPDSFDSDTPYAIYFNVTSPPAGDSDLKPYARYPGTAGQGGQLFFASELPPKVSNRLLVVNEGGDSRLGLRSARILLPEVLSDPNNICWGNCTGDRDVRGIGIGTGPIAEDGSAGIVRWSLVSVLIGVAASTLLTYPL